MSAVSPLASEPASRASQVELILGQLDQLPTLPAVAARLLQLTTSDSSSASDVAAVIKTDQALTARVLSLVRRAHLGVREVSSVERAIVLLGFEAVRNAVLAVQIYDLFRGAEPQAGAELDRVEFWKHSLGVACAARLLADRARLGRRSDEAFVCGLLHDLGKIALDACLPKSYARILRQTRSTGRCLCDVECEVLGVDHTVAGKRLASRWRLPQPIIDSVWLHHQAPASLPESIASREVVKVVHVADQLVRRQRIGYSGYHHADGLGTLAGVLGLDTAAVEAVIEALPEQMQEHCRLIGLEDLTARDLYAKAVAEANAELGRLNVALAEANRRLELRARCFDTLSRFTGSLSLDDTVGAVCLAAGRCARQLLQLEAAVAFYRDAGSGLFHVGACAPGDERIETLAAVVDGEGAEWVASNGGDRPASWPGPAPATAQPVIGHFQRLLGTGPVHMWPMTHTGEVIGGVLFRLTADGPATPVGAAEELEALGIAFGLAVAEAADRARSDRLNEELAHANRQLHQARDELLRAKSLAMIAEMAAGTAHELNNPLAVISGRAQLLAGRLTDPQQRREAEIIQDHAHRASDIVSDMLSYAKPGPPQLQAVPLADWLAELAADWRRRASLEGGQLQVTLSDSSVRVLADAHQLRHVFDALLANAIDAAGRASARLVINSTSLASDDRIVVAVDDNGTGMAPRVLEHAADPFFSHRQAGRGRGMGLSLATRLAANNGGRLWLESAVGVGTKAFVELPSANR